MTVHSRGAAAEAITRLVDAQARAILHWYTGSLRDAEVALGAGLYFSVNPAMLRSDRGLALIRLVPADQILLESDGPYCTHVGRPATPVDLGYVVRELSRLWQVDRVAAVLTIKRNLARITDTGSR
jgi:TatD DNase family protein